MVLLRKSTKDDEKEIRECYKRSVSIHQPWTFEPEDYAVYLAQTERFFLCLEKTHLIVGTFNISNIVRGYFQSAYLGYEVFSPHQRQGYMSQGLKLLLHYAFTELNLHRLEANVQPENKYSIRLLAKSGFIKEGYSKKYLNVGNKGWRDHERWAILNDEWQYNNS
jgi:[ribosomal protein S5]-alanine N-acetyltransferase